MSRHFIVVKRKQSYRSFVGFGVLQSYFLCLDLARTFTVPSAIPTIPRSDERFAFKCGDKEKKAWI
tara:strand:- start:210 stop:407 length:198 start_codon:yes stop_codon:yes gene_type:complete